jgi:two-component system, OmpR family, sensor histidine kinase KdpD
MTSDRKRPTPEELLRRAEAEERQQRRGRLKVFLGYASGVGKSFRMLDEGRRRKLRGQDVVVGAVQPDTGQNVVPLLEGLEVIPFRRDLGAPCLDLPAIVRRRPGVCLIDGLAYRNPPGAANAERWQDVEELLNAGISVITTINLQYVRERQSDVERIRGKQVADAVPESFLRGAEDIEVVDAPPEYCLHRAQAGDSGNIAVMEWQLSELREIALLLAAEVVEAQLDAYLKRHGIEHTYGTQERVLVCVTPRSNAELMIVRGRRQADRFHGDLHVAYVEQNELPDSDRTALDRHLEFASRAQAHVEILRGDDLVRTLLDYSYRHGITQIFVGHSQRKGFWQRFVPNPVERLIAESSGIDVRVFPNTTPFEVD